MRKFNNQAGQVVLILLLLVAVGLTIGISMFQRSISNLTTSTTTEESTRAFSAAEAGIEKALTPGAGSNINVSLNNLSTATVNNSPLLPQSAGDVIEYPPVSKEEFTHVWLADYTVSPPNLPAVFYDQGTLQIYWGMAGISSDLPAVNVNVIYRDSTGLYKSKKFHFDADLTRVSTNGFLTAAGTGLVGDGCGGYTLNTILGNNRGFLCRATLSGLPTSLTGNTLMLIRARVLYSNTSQPLAFGPTCNTGRSCQIPPQVRIIRSTGQAGDSQRRLQVFKIDNVVSPYLEFALFTAGEITK